MNKIYRLYPKKYGSGHGTAAVLLPGFAITWLQNQVTRQPQFHIDDLVQGCSNSIANALELLQSCTNPSIYSLHLSVFYWCLVLISGYFSISFISFSTLRPRQNGSHFPDNIFKCIFLNENVWIPVKISLTFVPKVRINNIPALVQIMAWYWPGTKPLSEPMLVSLLMHICITRAQRVKVISQVLRQSYDCPKCQWSIWSHESTKNS